MLDTLGSGAYGVVHRCLKIATKELVALKVVSNVHGKKELGNLEALREIGQDKNNLVRFIGHHTKGSNLLLEFEKLDTTLLDWVIMSGDKGRPLLEIQVITKQLLVALTALKSVSLVHTDIKPNNIMLVDQQLQPSKVKLIDFGMATHVSELDIGDTFQILGFRAPEVMLGLPLNEAIDMWALGCVLAYLYLGTYLYKPGSCKFHAMKNLVQLNGQPNDNLLNSGRFTKKFFTKRKCVQRQSWRLREHCSCNECTVPQRKDTSSSRGSTETYTVQECRQFASLDDIVSTRPDTAENEDTQAFLSLLKQMLHSDAKKRISPSEALQHPFMTLKHFPSECVSKPVLLSARERRRLSRLAGSTANRNNTCVISKAKYKTFTVTCEDEASLQTARGGPSGKFTYTGERTRGPAGICTQNKRSFKWKLKRLFCCNVYVAE